MKARVRGQPVRARPAARRRATSISAARGDAVLALVDGVEQLDQFFGQYLPQLVVAALTPLLIFVFMAFLDLPTAVIFLVFALLTLVLPAAFHRWNSTASLGFPACPGGDGRRLPGQHPGPGDAQGVRPEPPARARPGRARAPAVPQHDVGAGHQHRHGRHHVAAVFRPAPRSRWAGARCGSRPASCRCRRCWWSCCWASRCSVRCATWSSCSTAACSRSPRRAACTSCSTPCPKSSRRRAPSGRPVAGAGRARSST